MSSYLSSTGMQCSQLEGTPDLALSSLSPRTLGPSGPVTICKNTLGEGLNPGLRTDGPALHKEH